MSVLAIDTAPVFEPLLHPARYKGAHGGRGSGKSRFFAGLLIEDALRFPGEAQEGLRALCFREIQKSLKESAKFLLEATISEYGLGERDGFKVYTDVIKTPGDGVIAFAGMQDHTADSVKSYEGFQRAWGEEAQSISDRSLSLLRPTIRWENQRLGLSSELWFGWNPRRKNDPVDVMLRQSPPTGSVVVKANWRDNPWFPSVLEQERQDCLANQPDQYDHIWEGGYATVNAGAYFASLLADARAKGRIGRVAADPLLGLRAYWDIGGTGDRADARAIWIVQFVGQEIRVLDYHETEGQPLSVDIQWLRDGKYERAHMVLPHDGSTHDRVHDVTYESALRDAGFTVSVIKNQGKGAALQRIEAVRRYLPACWFNEATCAYGIDALGWYHERRDDARGMGLGPDHDWSSHGADAFGLMCVDFSLHKRIIRPAPKFTPRNVLIV